MNVTKDNIFPGAKISVGGACLTVVKVNDKSFYAGDVDWTAFQEGWKGKMKGTTLKAFYKAYGVLQYQYSKEIQISDDEAARKEKTEQNKDISFSLSQRERKEIADEVARLRKKNTSLRLQQVFIGKKIARFLEENGDDFLINIDGDYILLSLKTGESIRIASVMDYGDKYDEVPWHMLSHRE